MNSMKKLIRIVIVLGVFVLLCGILPRLVPAILPTISIEAEPVFCIGGNLANGCAGGFGVTNSLLATALVDVLLIGLFWSVTRKLKEVPSGTQNFLEAMIDILFGQARQIAGSNAAKIFPVGATIFLFVFFANYMELVPFVDSVGYVHHAEGKTQGYELDKSTPEGSAVVFINPSCKVITTDAFNRLTKAAQQARADAGCQAPISATSEDKGWAVVPTVRTATTAGAGY